MSQRRATDGGTASTSRACGAGICFTPSWRISALRLWGRRHDSPFCGSGSGIGMKERRMMRRGGETGGGDERLGGGGPLYIDHNTNRDTRNCCRRDWSDDWPLRQSCACGLWIHCQYAAMNRGHGMRAVEIQIACHSSPTTQITYSIMPSTWERKRKPYLRIVPCITQKPPSHIYTLPLPPTHPQINSAPRSHLQKQSST